MTPKEKAIDLYEYYFGLVADTPDPEWRAKDAAMSTVSEIIWAMGGPIKCDKYWTEVLEEIKKLWQNTEL